MDDEYRDRILALVVDEAVKKDKDKGMIIDNPSGYHRYKMERARHQAKEDPAWLLRQRDRLLGAVSPPLGFNICERCGAPLQPSVTFEYNDKNYCDISCAEGNNAVMSLREHMWRLKTEGPKTGVRYDGTEFTITYEQMAKINPRLAMELEADDEF
jgi:hypothetical protein